MRDVLDPELERRLADLGPALNYPSAPHLVADVRARIADAPATRRWARPFRLSLGPRVVLATVLLLLVVTGVAAAASLILLPGLRVLIVPGAPTTAPPSTATPGTLGDGLGLGVPVPSDQAAPRAGFSPVDASGTEWGPPDRTFVRPGVVTQVWASRPGVPATRASGLGLVVTQIAGRVDEGWYEKQLTSGAATVERVTVGGAPGWWVSGEPHLLVYVSSDGEAVEETRRVVGDVLIWRLGDVTMRIESGLGQGRTVALGEAIARASDRAP